MTHFLIKTFIKSGDTQSPKTRTAYGTLSSVVGVACNLVLFALKLLMGLLANSVAVTADAFNNLSDVGSSAVSFLGFRMANKPADKDHPFGHGRIEYLSGLIVSFLILLVGFDFIKTSFERIFNPSPVVFSWVVIAALTASMALKFWMCRFNRKLSRDISSAAIAATATDSLSDVMATAVTLISVVISQFTALPIDGFMGLVVAGIILFAGYKSASDTVSPLLGKAPDPQLIEDISRRVLSYEGIVGIHDLIVHDYGPGRIFASAHAEVPLDQDILSSHEVIDLAERQIAGDLGLHMLIHMDPVDTDCAETLQLRQAVEELVRDMDPSFSLHDFRVVLGARVTNLIFDLCVPVECRQSDEQLTGELNRRVKGLDPKYAVVLTVDRAYIALPAKEQEQGKKPRD